MKLLVSNFMSRARRLPHERRSFLLDMMEQTRQSYERISENSQYERYPLNYTPWERFALWERKKRELSLTVQTGSVAMWLVLDDPKKRSAQEIELRLREIPIGHASRLS